MWSKQSKWLVVASVIKFTMKNKYWSFQSEVFIFRGGNNHDVPAPEVPDCCEMEGHVGNDHQILEQSKKRITCNVVDNGTDQQNCCCCFRFLFRRPTWVHTYSQPHSTCCASRRKIQQKHSRRYSILRNALSSDATWHPVREKTNIGQDRNA